MVFYFFAINFKNYRNQNLRQKKKITMKEYIFVLVLETMEKFIIKMGIWYFQRSEKDILISSFSCERFAA